MVDHEGFASAESLRPVIRAVFGADRYPLGVERLAGGSKKGVYRVEMSHGGTVLVYIWSDTEDYWQGVLPPGSDDPADPYSHASGFSLFEAAARRFELAGVRCPAIRFSDRSQGLYPADIVVVEDVTGGSLEALLDTDPPAAARPMAMIAEWLSALAAVRAASPGKVGYVDAGGRVPASCEDLALEHSRSQLREAAGRDARAAAGHDSLADALLFLAEAIEPRQNWALVHGELGPDHVLLDRRGLPVLIDIEGAKYFDVEAEHVWTRMRFAENYPRLQPCGLDEDRMRFYQLCMHVDLVAGPLRIAETNHPQREWFRALAEDHLTRALRYSSQLS